MMKIYTYLFLLVAILFSTVEAGTLKGKIKLDDESLNNVVVYLEPLNKTTFPESKEVAVMDQINLSFVPHVLPVMIGTKVIFPNSDRIRHSVFSTGKIKKFDFGTYAPGDEKSIICNEAGVIPILCYIHHDMSAYIIVLNTPLFSVTDDDGEFVLDNIPEGKYKLSFWHEENTIKSEEINIPASGTISRNISISE